MDALQPPRGIFAATPCPLAPGAGIDEARLGAFLAKLARVPGLAGFLLNGHAGENVAMAPADQRRVIEIARAAAPATALVVGVNAESAAVAAAQAAKAEAAGADAIMVFPPNGWALYQEREMVLDHHRAVLEATRCPLFLFQASVAAGRMAYPPETLSALCTLARVIGIKEGSWEVATYEANRRLVHAVAPHIAVMGSGDEHLLTSYVIGSEGSLVSLAAVVPELVIALFEAVRAGDLTAARAAHERLYPLARAIYREAPAGRANARLKTCLMLIGRFADDAMLAPVLPTPSEEHSRLIDALRQAGVAVKTTISTG